MYRIADRIAPVIARTILFDDGGQALAEYALIAASIAILCVVAVSFLGAQLFGQYQSISNAYP